MTEYYCYDCQLIYCEDPQDEVEEYDCPTCHAPHTVRLMDLPQAPCDCTFCSEYA